MMTTTVVPGPDRRRRWSAAEKLRIAEESLASGLSVVEFARQHDITPSLVHTWRKRPANHACRRAARRERFAHRQIEGGGCSGIGGLYTSGVQFQGSSAPIRLIGWSAMRARTSRK